MKSPVVLLRSGRHAAGLHVGDADGRRAVLRRPPRRLRRVQHRLVPDSVGIARRRVQPKGPGRRGLLAGPAAAATQELFLPGGAVDFPGQAEELFGQSRRLPGQLAAVSRCPAHAGCRRRPQARGHQQRRAGPAPANCWPWASPIGAAAVVVSGEIGVHKPKPAIFRYACQLLDAEPGDCLFVGDQLDTDARAATAAGLHGVWLNRRRAVRPRLHVESIESLEEVPAVIQAHAVNGDRVLGIGHREMGVSSR